MNEQFYYKKLEFLFHIKLIKYKFLIKS
jgi:hypothetical protein